LENKNKKLHLPDSFQEQRNLFASGFITVGILLIGISIVLLLFFLTPKKKTWVFQSIDTMKYSRDLAREKLTDPDFDTVIDLQIANIAKTGATHVGIATPYDDEFLPLLKRWVLAARKNDLNVWFRGNFSGWEEWFGYEKISREEHLSLTRRFLENNEELFVDGDVFTACPECENGGPGDPRETKDIEGHRNFLIAHYDLGNEYFGKHDKKVKVNYNSMNYDVAKLIMDRATTERLGGIVTVDHYVSDSSRLNQDITEIARISGGKVVLGEYGAPIPDIHGEMSEIEQKEWLQELLKLLKSNSDLVGLNYWVSEGGSTQLWNNGSPRAAANVISEYYIPK